MKSIYFYVHDNKEQDKIIVEIEKIFNRNKCYWFFIKYWHGGPHLRIRFADLNNSNIETELVEYLTSKKTDLEYSTLTAEEYYKYHTFDGEDLNVHELPWYNQGDIVHVPYDPEYHRYGEGKVLGINESIFNFSTLLISEFLEKETTDFKSKLLFSFYIFTKFLDYIPTVNDKKNFLLNYTGYWGKFSTDKNVKLKYDVLMQKLDAIINYFDKKYGKQFDKIYCQLDDLEKIVDYNTLLYMISSQIHMTNNRLGVPPNLEYEIALQLLKVMVGDKYVEEKF
ncbi:lantibiotic dehydratase C-terminal domain-containing protein [Lysinibacillus xylanilyticus]|uniref:lantibiotic dehydratase C-terminal domain-containing protein n=1 Tax=Lysinibacillus xylanilyticus TaxID=582475 RepID=UPI0037F7CC9B